MPDDNQFQALSSQILRMAHSVTAQTDIPNADLRRVLNFLDKLVQVVDQAFRGVYTILVDIKLLDEADIANGQIRAIRKDLEMVSARSWYRDAEEICSRLHHLSDNFQLNIEPIVDSLNRGAEWRDVFQLMDEHEGHIISIVEESVWEVKNLLANLQTADDLAQARQVAEKRGQAMQQALQDLTEFHNRILGLSGTTGFLELIETDRDAVAAQLQVLIDNSVRWTTNISTGGGAYVEGNVSVSGGDFVGNTQNNPLPTGRNS